MNDAEMPTHQTRIAFWEGDGSTAWIPVDSTPSRVSFSLIFSDTLSSPYAGIVCLVKIAKAVVISCVLTPDVCLIFGLQGTNGGKK